MKDKTGGPAFPRELSSIYENDTGTQHYSEDQKGMTLLDYFAGKAMHYFISNGDHEKLTKKGDKKEIVCEKISRSSYELASKMIKEREKWN